MEWKEVTLGEITNLVIDYRGKTPLKLGSSWSDSGYRALSAKNIKTGQIVAEDSIRFVDEELYRKWMKDEVKKGDILITSEAPFGQIYYWDSDEKIVLSQRLFDVRLNDEVCHKYVYYFMTSHRYQKDLEGRATGTTVTGLRQPELLKSTILLPPLSAQRSISSILSSLDRKIELNNKINADLEEMAQAIFKNWFVDFEPFKDGKFVDSELGMIPEGWKVGSLGDFCNVFTGKKNTNQAIEKGLYPFFSCAPEPLASNDAIFNGKAIIIAGNGSYTGRTSFYNGGFDLYQRTYACTIREQDKENLMIFFYHMMKQFFEPTKMGGTRGSSIPYIVMGDITQQKIPYSEDWLIRFSNIANSMMDRKLRIDKENSRLSLLRDTLLPRLMSGEIEVPE